MCVCAGVKAGRVVKRTTSSLITSRWTKDYIPITSLSLPSPSPAFTSVPEDQYSLLDADSILARDVANLRTAAALEQIDDFACEVHSPAEVISLPVGAPALDESVASAPPAERPAAVEPAPAAEVPPLPASTSLQAHSAVREEAHAPAQPTAAQPAAAVEPAPAVEHLKPSLEPSQTQSAAHQAATFTPLQAEPATPAKPDVAFQPTRAQLTPPPSPNAALPVMLSQAALPQAAPAAQASHNPLAAQGSSGEESSDKVVSTGCLGVFSCFKAGRNSKRGTFGRKKQPTGVGY